MADKLELLTGNRTDLIASINYTLEGRIAESQRGLLDLVVNEFLDKLETDGGVILNSTKNRRLLSLLDEVFTQYNATHGLEIVKTIVDGVSKIIDFNANYFSTFDKPAILLPIKTEAANLISGWLGIVKNNVKPNGYLDTLIKDPRIKNQIRNIAVKEIITQGGYNQAKEAVQTYVAGNKEKAGALQSYARNFVYDLYSQVDGANSQVYADKLNLDYAIYEGGLIKTSRKFCIDKNGKVFTREEIEKFNPTEAKPPDYNPFLDRGGYGCRHHYNWIPKALAFTLRPDLKDLAQ